MALTALLWWIWVAVDLFVVGCKNLGRGCPIDTASGRAELYRPTFRPEILRKIVNRYLEPGGGVFPKLRGTDRLPDRGPRGSPFPRRSATRAGCGPVAQGLLSPPGGGA